MSKIGFEEPKRILLKKITNFIIIHNNFIEKEAKDYKEKLPWTNKIYDIREDNKKQIKKEKD